MIFREATQDDIRYMSEYSINRDADRIAIDRVDYIYTLEDDGKPLMTGGFRMIVPSTAWCWVDLSQECNGKLLSAYETIVQWIDTFIETHTIQRLQAAVRDNEKAIRLIEHLGFEKESTMKNFFGNEDAFLYVRRPHGHER